MSGLPESSAPNIMPSLTGASSGDPLSSPHGKDDTEVPFAVRRIPSHDSSVSTLPTPPPPPRPPPPPPPPGRPPRPPSATQPTSNDNDDNDDESSTDSPPPPPPPPMDDESIESSRPSRTLSQLPTPAFVINRHAFSKNCRIVSESAKSRNLRLRPHIKTHKTVEGAWVQAHGLPFEDEEPIDGAVVTGFVASTLPEVSMLVQAALNFGGPFQDILYGVPVCESKIATLYKLRLVLQAGGGDGGNVHILMDHPQQVASVEKFLLDTSSSVPFSVFLKLDTGYHRAGITCDERGIQLAERIILSPSLKLYGVYSHCGHAYDSNDDVELDNIARTDLSTIHSFLISLEKHMVSKGVEFCLDDLSVSVGSTPSVFHHENRVGLKNLEIHPGNYTLMDRQQLWTGACAQEQNVAGRVLARVIGHYEDRNTIMLDAGATALTKEDTPQGGVCAIHGFPELECFKMSQEVTLVRPKNVLHPFPFDKLPLGSMVNLMPNHSCLAAACFDKYYVIDDPSCSFSPKEVVIEEWNPTRGFSIDSER